MNTPTLKEAIETLQECLSLQKEALAAFEKAESIATRHDLVTSRELEKIREKKAEAKKTISELEPRIKLGLAMLAIKEEENEN